MAKRQAACTHCGRVFQVDEAQAGRRARCRGCNETFVIAFPAGLATAADTTATAAPAPEEIAPASEAPSVTQAAQLRGLRAEAVDLEQRRARAQGEVEALEARRAAAQAELERLEQAAREREAQYASLE